MHSGRPSSNLLRSQLTDSVLYMGTVMYVRYLGVSGRILTFSILASARSRLYLICAACKLYLISGVVTCCKSVRCGTALSEGGTGDASTVHATLLPLLTFVFTLGVFARDMDQFRSSLPVRERHRAGTGSADFCLFTAGWCQRGSSAEKSTDGHPCTWYTCPTSRRPSCMFLLWTDGLKNCCQELSLLRVSYPLVCCAGRPRDSISLRLPVVFGAIQPHPYQHQVELDKAYRIKDK